jgi:hypothetical protein
MDDVQYKTASVPWYSFRVTRLAFSSSALLLLFLQGCHAPALPSVASHQAVAEQRAEVEGQREQLQAVPPPTKGRYMAVHSFESWENPFLTVQQGMVELYVTQADPNTSTLGTGGMLRPIGARRQELNISLDDLGEAMAAVPQSAWPYGRVVAIEEAHKTPPSAEPAVRRSMEAAVGKLNDLGIVVYDLNEGKVQ